jgi:hypothetical protein
VCLAEQYDHFRTILCPHAQSGDPVRSLFIIHRNVIGYTPPVSPSPPPVLKGGSFFDPNPPVGTQVLPEHNPQVTEEIRKIRRFHALIKLMRECKEFEQLTGCACGFNKCKAGKGENGQVTQGHCFACLEETHEIK